MSETWPRWIAGTKHDGTPMSLAVTREAVLEILLQKVDSSSAHTLLTWLSFTCGALYMRPDFFTDLTCVEQKDWADFLRQMADRLDPSVKVPIDEK